MWSACDVILSVSMWAVSLKITTHTTQFIHDSIDLMHAIFAVREGGTRAVLNADVVAKTSMFVGHAAA